MFTVRQISDLHTLVKAVRIFHNVPGLRSIGVRRCDMYVADGRASYSGIDVVCITSDPETGTPLHIADHGTAGALQDALSLHQSGASDYAHFCRRLLRVWKNEL